MAAIAIAAGSRKTQAGREDEDPEAVLVKGNGPAHEHGLTEEGREKAAAALTVLNGMTTEEIQELQDKMSPKARFSALQIIFSAWFTWLFGGALVYTLINDWPYATSLYYAADVGYSIGYGAIYEYNDASLVFSILMILAGASFIGGAIGFFAEMAIESADASATANEGDIAPVVGGEKTKSCLENLTLVQWAKKYYAENTLFVRVFGLFFLWVTMGTIYGVHYEGWPILRSLYFAVSGMSTAGLQAPGTVEEGYDKHLPTFGGWFMGLFSATGVPIFGLALGQLGGLLVDKHIEKKELDAMSRLITREEFESVADLDGSGEDSMVGFTEFAVLEMIRLGRTNVEQINHIRKEFNKRDADGSGAISWTEIRKFQVIRAAKALEIQRLMTHGYKKNKAIDQVESKPVEELGILEDITSLMVTLELTRKSSKAFSRQNSKGKPASDSEQPFAKARSPPLPTISEPKPAPAAPLTKKTSSKGRAKSSKMDGSVEMV